MLCTSAEIHASMYNIHSWQVGAQSDGKIRLAGGSGACGRVEIYHNKEWGTVCDDYFDCAEANVVCKQLGYLGGNASCCAAYGQGIGRIWMDNVECAGSEVLLSQCSFRGWGVHDCAHDKDVGVCCNQVRS